MSATVRDSRSMDPVFAQVVQAIYGEEQPAQEIWDHVAKSMPTLSDVHINSTNRKKERRLAHVGLAATGVAAVAGGHAIHASVKNAKHASQEVKEGTYKAGPVLRRLKLSPKKALAVGTAGWVGLHTAEIAADSLAARSQLKTLNATKEKKPKKLAVAKAKTTGHIKLHGVKRPIKGGLKPVTEGQVIANNIKVARHGKAALLGVAAVGAGVGGYMGAKKYALRPVKMPALPNPAAKKKQPVGVTKRATDELTWEGTISKVDTDKRLVFGWCSLSKVNGQPVVDLQNDYIPIEETEAAAYRYVIESRRGGDMHRRVSKGDEPLHTADLVESMVFTPEKLQKMGLAPDALPEGWWIGMKVNDEEQWQKVKNKERLGFSIHGKGRRVEKAL